MCNWLYVYFKTGKTMKSTNYYAILSPNCATVCMDHLKLAKTLKTIMTYH